jgi:hypothetical protein
MNITRRVPVVLHRQSGFEVSVDEMLSDTIVEEWLCIGPVTHREMWVCGKKTTSDFSGLLQSAKLGETGRKDARYRRPFADPNSDPNIGCQLGRS